MQREIMARGGPRPADRARYDHAASLLDEAEENLNAPGNLGFLPFVWLGLELAFDILLATGAVVGAKVIANAGEAASNALPAAVGIGKGVLAVVATIWLYRYAAKGSRAVQVRGRRARRASTLRKVAA